MAIQPIYTRAVDINGDGFSDIIVPTNQGKTYVIFGHSMATPFPDIDLTLSLTPSGLGFKV